MAMNCVRPSRGPSDLDSNKGKASSYVVGQAQSTYTLIRNNHVSRRSHPSENLPWRAIFTAALVIAAGFFIKCQIEDYGERMYQAGYSAGHGEGYKEGYKAGVEEADTKWTAAYNEAVKKHNTEVARLKAESARMVAELKAQAQAREAQLSKIIDGLKAPVIWQPGPETKCIDTSGEPKSLYDKESGFLAIPMSPAFVQSYNRIQDAAERVYSLNYLGVVMPIQVAASLSYSGG